MSRNIVALLIVTVVMLFFVSPVLAEDICEESVTTVCIGCHNADRVCDNLGLSEKTWKNLLDWMVSNGAELEEDTVAEMVKCFSQPSAGVKAACGK